MKSLTKRKAACIGMGYKLNEEENQAVQEIIKGEQQDIKGSKSNKMVYVYAIQTKDIYYIAAHNMMQALNIATLKLNIDINRINLALELQPIDMENKKVRVNNEVKTVKELLEAAVKHPDNKVPFPLFVEEAYPPTL